MTVNTVCEDDGIFFGARPYNQKDWNDEPCDSEWYLFVL